MKSNIVKTVRIFSRDLYKILQCNLCDTCFNRFDTRPTSLNFYNTTKLTALGLYVWLSQSE